MRPLRPRAWREQAPKATTNRGIRALIRTRSGATRACRPRVRPSDDARYGTTDTRSASLKAHRFHRGRAFLRGGFLIGPLVRTRNSDTDPAARPRAGFFASVQASEGGASPRDALHRPTSDHETERNRSRKARERPRRENQRRRDIIAARLIRARFYEP